MPTYYGCYRTHTFTEVVALEHVGDTDPRYWDDVSNFLYDFKSSPFYDLTKWTTVSSGVTTTHYLLTDDEIKLIYWLLYANYGNSNIASNDEERFKQRLFALAIQYAPKWIKAQEIQKSLRTLTSDELFKGGKAVYNSALNPQTTPSTSSLDELNYINQQNTTNYQKSKMDAYAQLWELLKVDATQDFVDKFKKLFITVVSPDAPLLYEEV